MAAKKQQGTGKHPHKITEEPQPRHDAKARQTGGGEQQSESQNRRATGGREAGSAKREEAASGSQEDADLKEREYRDNQGEVDHHARSYMEQHRGEGRSESSDKSSEPEDKGSRQESLEHEKTRTSGGGH